MKFKNGKRLIRRRCGDGCGLITNYGKKYLPGHNRNTHTKEWKKKCSIRMMGNTNGKANKGKKQSEEHILKRALAQIKPNPNYQYGCEWQDPEYIKDLRKNYCENKDCKDNYKYLVNHHIYLDKKRCAPDDVITLCNPCHAWLHQMLAWHQKANLKDFIIINRPDHVSYIRKSNKQIIRINKVNNKNG